MTTTLFPSIEPYNHFYLDLDSVHSLYVEECGNPEGIPAVFIHGGPGAGCSADDRRFFDPARYRIILFDQRGCGRSLPLAELKDNTTQYLIADIEKIRQHLKINQWVVFGGSWGSTLGLAYAQAHPGIPLALILRGVFLGTQSEIDFFTDYGMGRFYPQEYLRFKQYLPKQYQDNPDVGYYKLMTTGDKESRVAAAKSYTAWPMACLSLTPGSVNLSEEEPEAALAEALLEVHYMVNQCFLSPGQLMDGMDKIQHIPTKIVQGRYDLITPPIAAYEVHKALPNSELNIINTAGHYSRDPGTAEGLVDATNSIAASLLESS